MRSIAAASSAALLAACVGGCCGTARPPAVQQALARQEQARVARLPTDGRAFDATWGLLHVEAHEVDKVTEGAVQIHRPKLRVFQYGPGGGSLSSSPPHLPKLQQELHKLTPLDVDQISIFDGEVVLAELGMKGHPELWLHDLEISLENIGTRPALQQREPILLAARARVQRSGRLVAFMTADPWGGLDFSGRVEITGLKSEELYGFLAPKAGVRAPEGTIDLYIAFQAHDGVLRGGAKPVIRNLKLRSTGGAWSCFKAKTGDFFASLLGRGPNNRVATVVPIEGRVTGPAVEIWPAILGVLYDALIQGIASGFGGLPPQLAPSKTGAGAQAGRVLLGGERPRAQPTSGGAQEQKK